MLIIGEKLNSAIPSVREAMLSRDVDFIKELAKKQAAGGADFLDINTAQGSSEIDDMDWVVRAVQEVVDVPLCIDSVSPDVIRKGLEAAKGKSMLNSLSMESSRLKGMLPLVREFDCSVIALTMDDNGIPKTAEERIKIAGQLVDTLKQEKVDLEKVYIDPLVLPLAVNSNNGIIFFECLTEIKRLFGVKTVSGLSNVSHSLPKRKLINRNFLTICMSHGMDAAIMDPTDAKINSSVMATNLLLNNDRFSRNYLKAFRSNTLED